MNDAAFAVLAAEPGHPTKEWNWALEAARSEIAKLTEAMNLQGFELAVVRATSAISERGLLGAARAMREAALRILT